MPFKYIGRTTTFRGKSLWEIVGNLKNYGVGRYIVQSRYERYPEPTFMKVLKVEACDNPDNPGIDNMRKVRVTVENTFRGKKIHDTIIEGTSYKTDYRLIPKDEEDVYKNWKHIKAEFKILPKFSSLPPLLRELTINEMIAKGQPVIEEPTMEIVYKEDTYNKYKIDDKNELPPVKPGLEIQKTLSLYKGLKI